jgi:hypothetical protein
MSLGLVFDLPGALVQLYGVIKKDQQLAAFLGRITDWVKLILSCVFSGLIALLGAWGAALLSHSTPWVAFGYGLGGSAVAIFTVLLRMPQGRSLMLAVPKSTVEQYATDEQTIIEPVDNQQSPPKP